MNNIILGAGITGLSAGYHTGLPIYEATGNHGGICTSYKKDGFEFSVGGGHWLFENEKTTKAMDFIKSLVELNRYERRAGVYFNTIVEYPFQTFSQKPIQSTAGSFKHWLSEQFSQAECNMFFHPFNDKYTAGLYDSVIPFDSYKTPKAGGKGFVSVFYDPIGGLSVLTDKLASKAIIKPFKRASRVDWKNKVVVFDDGEEVRYNKLISTIPLDVMLDLCGQTHNLVYSSVFVLNIGATKGRCTPNEHWLYIPFSKRGFYRVGFYTNVNPNKAPENMVGLSVEMATRSNDYDNKTIFNIINELKDWGWIGEAVTIDPTFVKHAYTWNKSIEERIEAIEWLKDQDIICIGRYARWIFQGMMESIQQGLNCEQHV